MEIAVAVVHARDAAFADVQTIVLANNRQAVKGIFGQGEFAVVQSVDVNLEQGNRATYFIAHHQHIAAVGAFCFGDEHHTLRAKVAAFVRAGSAGIDPLDKFGLGRVGHIVEHYATYALQYYKGVETAVNFTNGYAFGFRAFVVRTVFECIVGVAGVEQAGKLRVCSRDALKVVARVPHQRAVIGVPDRERARTDEVNLVKIAVAVGIARCGGGLQSAQQIAALERSGVRENDRIQYIRAGTYTHQLFIRVVLAGIALVGSD